MFPILDPRCVKDGRTQTQFTDEAEWRKFEKFHRVGHRHQLSIGVKTCLCLDPIKLVAEAQLFDDFPRECVRRERDVIMLIPRNIANLPRRSEAADLICRFKKSDAFT